MSAATRAEILTELARIAARCNGLISKEAIAIWADDLFSEHTFTAEDYREAGRRMPERIAEGGRGAMAGRPQITDVVELAKAVRAKRLERAAALSSAGCIEARTTRTPAQSAADAKVMKWMLGEILAGRKISAEEIESKRRWFETLAEEAR